MNRLSFEDQSRLLVFALSGDDLAFKALYDYLKPQILSRCRALRTVRMEAEDLEAWLQGQVWRSLRDYDASRGVALNTFAVAALNNASQNLAAYLGRKSRQALANAIRDGEEYDLSQASDPTSGDAVCRIDTELAIRQQADALGLTDGQRRVMDAILADPDARIVDIARATGLSHAAVSSHLASIAKRAAKASEGK